MGKEGTEMTRMLTMPVKAYFAVQAIILAPLSVAILFYLMTPHYSPLTPVILGVVIGILLAAAATGVERHLRKRDGMTQRASYRKALSSGQLTGDVSRWSDWIKRDRRSNKILFVVGTAILAIGVVQLVLGLQSDRVPAAFPLAAAYLSIFWLQRHRLQRLSQKLLATAP
jgi:hypothetical protein